MKLRYLAIPVTIIGLGVASTCVTIIPQGHVGAVYDRLNKGVQNYTLGEGLNFKTPFQKINSFPT